MDLNGYDYRAISRVDRRERDGEREREGGREREGKREREGYRSLNILYSL